MSSLLSLTINETPASTVQCPLSSSSSYPSSPTLLCVQALCFIYSLEKEFFFSVEKKRLYAILKPSLNRENSVKYNGGSLKIYTMKEIFIIKP